MSDETKKLSPGDCWQPSAEALNGYQEAADFVRGQKAGGGALPTPTSRPPIIVKNTTYSDLPRFSILGIDGPIFTPSDNEEAFKSRLGLSGVSPALPDHFQKFVLLTRPIAAGDLGPAVVAGVVPVLLYKRSENHRYAHIANDNTHYLLSDNIGYPILWIDDETSSYNCNWALVAIGGAANLTMQFELKTDKTPGSSASAYYITSDDAADTDAVDFVFNVYDQTNGRQFRALGRDTMGDTTGGARGFARYNLSSGKLEIVAMQERAGMCLGTTTASVVKTDGFFYVNNVSPLDGGQSPVTSSSATLFVNNPGASSSQGFAIPAEAQGVVIWDEGSGTWRPLDFPCA